ncbi:MAG: hypothetical protein KDD63_28060 [Bacteroidetes bacterium]|nr:hypothetical protein [Bacteroidota bacterium]
MEKNNEGLFIGSFFLLPKTSIRLFFILPESFGFLVPFKQTLTKSNHFSQFPFFKQNCVNMNETSLQHSLPIFLWIIFMFAFQKGQTYHNDEYPFYEK